MDKGGSIFCRFLLPSEVSCTGNTPDLLQRVGRATLQQRLSNRFLLLVLEIARMLSKRVRNCYWWFVGLGYRLFKPFIADFLMGISSPCISFAKDSVGGWGTLFWNFMICPPHFRSKISWVAFQGGREWGNIPTLENGYVIGLFRNVFWNNQFLNCSKLGENLCEFYP